MTSAEFAITYQPRVEKEMLPSPKFEGIYWQGIPEEEALVGRRLCINNQDWVVEVVGFQGSEGAGNVAMHQEPTQQEDVFFLVGAGEMTIWNGMECQMKPDQQNLWEHPLFGVMSIEEAKDADYVLAVASDLATGVEKLVLNITTAVGKMLVVEPLSTQRGRHHGTQLDKESMYFVVKRSPYTIDIHELVRFTGPYGGGN